jgi:hypothetical protein
VRTGKYGCAVYIRCALLTGKYVNKEIYQEHRRRANKICRERKREMLKRQMESIEMNWERADIRKYYQTVNRLRKGFRSHLNASKDSSVKLIEVDDRILEH